MASKIKVDQLLGSTGDVITVPTGQTFTVTDGIPVASGGTGIASFTAGDILYATGATTLTKLNKGTAEQVLAMNSGATAPDWGSVDLTVLPTITVAKGGTNIPSFTAGDIMYATGTTTLAKLVKGSAADVLTMNSGATAPEWAAAAGGGKLLQVQNVFIDTPDTNTTSATYVDVTGMTVDITPSATSSKIMVLCDAKFSRATGNSASLRMMRDSTAIGSGEETGSYWFGNMGWDGSMSGSAYMNYSIDVKFLDSPNTTSATTYKVQYQTGGGVAVYMNRQAAASASTTRVGSSLTVMEIGA